MNYRNKKMMSLKYDRIPTCGATFKPGLYPVLFGILYKSPLEQTQAHIPNTNI